MGKISSYGTLATPAGGDLLVAVDVSDTTMAATGTDKTLTLAALQAFVTTPGLLYVTGGGTISTSTITTAQGNGYTGLYLDPRAVWNMGGVVFDAVQDFIIESRMTGSIGWTGNITYNTSGYIDTGSGTDGIQVYASTPGGSTATQGVIFRNCVIKGTNSRAVVHFGGGQRRCGLVDTLVYNANSTSGAYGVAVDSGLSDNNSENSIFSFTGGGGIAGAYAALGIGVFDQTQHANDTLWTGLSTSAGTYAINHANGGGHMFTMFYDRSSPATATINSTGGGRLVIQGTELQNGSGNSVICSGGEVILNACTVTATSNSTTIVQTGGSVIFRDYVNFNAAQTMTLNGGTADFSDAALGCSNLSVTGSSGALVLLSSYPGSGSAPVHSGFSGTVSSIA